MDESITLDERLKPIIADVTTKVLGIKIDALANDISVKIAKMPFIDFVINTSIKFKIAKRQFKRIYIEKILEMYSGNISEAALEAGIDRRSMHRLILQFHIPAHKIKAHVPQLYQLKFSTVSHAIENVLDTYKSIIHPQKIEQMYKHVGQLSGDVLKELPDQKQTLADAEEEFERKYFKQALIENNNNITQTARKIGLRYETLQRKVKQLHLL
ncbi:MAG: helix-turn-helix domain-containing protein [Candidatus Woesearchaeota archaeon]|jgi:DNA-binding NtrC family response regulator